MAMAKKPAAPKRAATKKASKGPIATGTGVTSGSSQIPYEYRQFTGASGARTRVYTGKSGATPVNGLGGFSSRAALQSQRKQAASQLAASARPKGGVRGQMEDSLGFDKVGTAKKGRTTPKGKK